jgi:hypothetical protein
MRRRRLGVAVLGLLCLALLAIPAVAAAEISPLSSFGEYGTGAGQMSEPGDGEYAPDGNLFVGDYGNNRIDVFSSSGGFLYAFGAAVNVANGGNVCTAASGCTEGGHGGEAGSMWHPEAVSILDGKVYVADAQLDRVDEFEEDGQFVIAFGKGVDVETGGDICTEHSGCQGGEPGGTDASVVDPSGIAFSAENFYVTDPGNHRIDVFSPEGEFRGAIGKEVGGVGADVCFTGCQGGQSGSEADELEDPYGIATTSSGDLALADSDDRRVDVYGPRAGEGLLFAFGAGVGPSNASVCTVETGCVAGAGGTGAGELTSPTVVTTDSSGDYFVSDVDSDRISEFSSAGAFISAFGEGVADGAATFQVCTTTCVAGIESTAAGSTPNAYGLAFNPSGQLSVIEEMSEPEHANFARVENFGTPVPPATGSTTPPATTSPQPFVAPSGKFKLGKVTLNKKKGTATVTVTPVAAGKFVLSGKGVKKSTGTGKANRPTTLKVIATGKTKKSLAKSGKATVKVKIVFTPTGGKATTQTKKLTLKETLG